jgi:hypothetical protein
MAYDLLSSPYNENPTWRANAMSDLFGRVLGRSNAEGQALAQLGIDPVQYLNLERQGEKDRMDYGAQLNASGNQMWDAGRNAQAQEYAADAGVETGQGNNATLLAAQRLKNKGEVDAANVKAGGMSNISKLMSMLLPFILAKKIQPKIPEAMAPAVWNDVSNQMKKNPATAANPLPATAQAYGALTGGADNNTDKIIELMKTMRAMSGSPGVGL